MDSSESDYDPHQDESDEDEQFFGDNSREERRGTRREVEYRPAEEITDYIANQDREIEILTAQVAELTADVAELREENLDLRRFIIREEWEPLLEPERPARVVELTILGEAGEDEQANVFPLEVISPEEDHDPVDWLGAQEGMPNGTTEDPIDLDFSPPDSIPIGFGEVYAVSESDDADEEGYVSESEG